MTCPTRAGDPSAAGPERGWRHEGDPSDLDDERG